MKNPITLNLHINIAALSLPSEYLSVCAALLYGSMCHRDSINITHPSVKAVQMLSQKKRISAKLREEGDMMRG